MSASARQFNSAPERSLDQRLSALARANEVRSQRAALKARLKSGEVSLREVLLDPPDYVTTAKVLDLLMAAPKRGRVKSMRVLEQCRVSASKTVGGLSDRQRQALLDHLSE